MTYDLVTILTSSLNYQVIAITRRVPIDTDVIRARLNTHNRGITHSEVLIKTIHRDSLVDCDHFVVVESLRSDGGTILIKNLDVDITLSMDKIRANIEHTREGVSRYFNLIPIFVIRNALAQIFGQTRIKGTSQIACSLKAIILLI